MKNSLYGEDRGPFYVHLQSLINRTVMENAVETFAVVFITLQLETPPFLVSILPSQLITEMYCQR